MNEINTHSWEAFLSELEEVKHLHRELQLNKRSVGTDVSRLLYRGQPDAAFKLTTTLERNAPHLLDVYAHYRRALAVARPISEVSKRAWILPSADDIETALANGGVFRFHYLHTIT